MQWNCKFSRTAFMILFFLAGLALNSLAAIHLPDSPPRYVMDMAGVIDDAVESKLNRYLQELEQKTTAQMIVLTLPSLEGAEIRDFALNLAHDKWKLGQAGKDNGLLLLVAVKDRKYAIEVGYGLESVIPDSLAGEIGRRYLVPYFKQKDYSNGIYAGSLFLANTIAKDAGVIISSMIEVIGGDSKETRRKSSGPFSKIITGLLLLFGLYMFIRHPKAFITMLLLSSMGGSGRSGDWGGGGGGFGGGGGGGFGGGGASGSW
ncbi:MAG: TPM domain-containing protein [Proteobacteria bacterium]|nr:TPM domain-containing protein [Pseudomonadota bacterium]MBU4469829.1 TPM domain-containing protein [Pseudomonadota bacterium]MCG2753064.1 TPM domain-containing protein [Desulfobacteraceae bacterium]